MKTHVIEILYTERCRYLATSLDRVREAVARRTELDVEVRVVLVSSFAEAVTRRFRGSPTVRVDGEDVETRPGAVAPIGLLARGYVVAGRVERAPTLEAIEQALRQLVRHDAAATARGRGRGRGAAERTQAVAAASL